VGSSNPSGGCSVRTVMKFQRSLSVPNLFPSKLLRGVPNALTSAKMNIARTRASRKPESPDWERYSETERRPGSDPRAWQACHARYRNQPPGSARARQNQQLETIKALISLGPAKDHVCAASHHFRVHRYGYAFFALGVALVGQPPPARGSAIR
jgi:hypothetical protein